MAENRLKLERIANFVLYAFFLPLSEHEARLEEKGCEIQATLLAKQLFAQNNSRERASFAVPSQNASRCFAVR